MKICGACCETLSRDDFSKKQWQQKQHQRRCKECIAANNPLQLERPSCWICLGEGPDDVGLPLRRECSCRGSSGHCHLKCVVKYAQGKTVDDWQSTEQWVFCPNCEQQYGAHFSLDMAKEFVSYVEDKFPPLIFQQNPRHLAIHIIAHQVKIMVIRYRKDVDEMRRSAHFILSSMSRIKQVEQYPPSLLLDAEAYAHFCLGALSEYGGSNEDFESAIIHYENARDICQSMGDDTNVAMFEGLAAKVKAEREGNYVDEEEEAYSLQTKLVLESLEQHDIENVAELWEEEEHGKQKCVLKYRERHEKYIEDYGGEDPVSVEYGVELVNSLKLAGHGIEAERLASDLLVTSSRVLGRHHKSTRMVQRALHYCKTRIVGYHGHGQDGFSSYQLLDYNAAEDMYIIKGPLEGTIPDIVFNKIQNNQGEEIIADPSEVTILPGTPVFGCGLEGELSHLNGKLADFLNINVIPFKMRVHFEADNIEHLINRENMRVAIDLTEKE